MKERHKAAGPVLVIPRPTVIPRKSVPARALLAGLLAVAACLAAPGRAQRDEERLPRHAERWVKRTLGRMTLEQKVGQLLMVPYFGGFTNTESEDFRRLEQRVRELHVGGLIVATQPRKPTGYDRSEIYALAHLTNRLQAMAEVPLLVSADFERGAGFRIRETTSFPHNMALGASADPKLAYEMGRLAATEARALGVHWLFSPVADVNNNPLNPIINIRSFGEDPDLVAEMVAAYIRGCQEAGALCTAKHFPGSGDIALDPHLELATLTADRQRLDRVELQPFRAAVAADVAAIMTEHIAVPALEPEPGLPATFSHRITTELLRGELGFDGLITTDAMIMDAITDRAWPGEAAVRAVEAGADVVLMSPNPEAAFDSLRRAVESGRIPEARLNQSVERILRAKARLNLHQRAQVELGALDSLLASGTFEDKALEMADRGLVLLRNDTPDFLPLDATRPQRGFLLVVSADPDTFPGQELERELRPRADSLITARVDRLYFKPDEITLPSPLLYDWSIVAVFVRIADRKGNVALPDSMAALVTRVLRSDKPTALVILGSPYLAERFPQAKTVLCTHSTAEVAERAAIRALFGQTEIAGRMPVTIPAVAARGTGLRQPAVPMELAATPANGDGQWQPVMDILNAAVTNGTTPGGVVAVGHSGGWVALRPFGRMTYAEDAAPVATDTLYDLASVTKVVATTTAAMMLYERGALQLDRPVVDYLPEFRRGPDAALKERIRVRDLLTHSSGLPGYVRFYQEVETRAALLERIHALPLDYPTGTRSVYSDLGIILLGEILERVSGQPLDRFLQESLFGPLGLRNTLFRPPKQLWARVAPTEEDRDFRHRLIRGEVHDENAWVMGGVAPHAGLFSTAGDLAVFCQLLLNGGIYGHRRFLKRGTIEMFTTPQKIPDSNRALGWDTPTEPSSSGQYLSARAFGHTGFTGTSVWIDPAKELFVVLLTNRVHPTRENNRIRDLRPRLHDAVIEALALLPTPSRRAATQE